MVRWVWASMSPGSTVALGRSMRAASAGTLASAAGPALRILPASITIVWSFRVLPDFTSSKWAACTATRCVWPMTPAESHDSAATRTASVFLIAVCSSPGAHASRKGLTPHPSVQSPDAPGVCGVENDQQQQQRNMFQLGAEISPDSHAMSRRPPGGQKHVQEKENAKDRSRAHKQPQQKRDADQQLEHADQISEKNSVGQHQPGQNRAIKTHPAAGDVVPQISLKSAMGKPRSGHLVFAEQEE